MDDKLLLEDDIIDLTDLLEEGSPPKKPAEADNLKRKRPEPDSFDLGKEISMDYDVSVEEIEHDSAVIAGEAAGSSGGKPKDEPLATDDMSDLLKEPLGDIESDIDKALTDKLEEVGLTPKEEEVLLQESPSEEPPLKAEEQAVLMEEPVMTEEAPAMEPVPAAEPQTQPSPVEVPKVALPVDMPAEAILEAVIAEFKKDMPALLEGIVRPVVSELLQEVISSTREALPGIVERVIREEIDKLKKL